MVAGGVSEWASGSGDEVKEKLRERIEVVLRELALQGKVPGMRKASW